MAFIRLQWFHASIGRREEENRDAFHLNREELGYKERHTPFLHHSRWAEESSIINI